MGFFADHPQIWHIFEYWHIEYFKVMKGFEGTAGSGRALGPSPRADHSMREVPFLYLEKSIIITKTEGRREDSTHTALAVSPTYLPLARSLCPSVFPCCPFFAKPSIETLKLNRSFGP